MKFILAGGSGHLGSVLSAALAADGHSVVSLSRHPRTSAASRGVREVGWTPDGSSGPWARELADADGIVNLAGAGIADARWTPARKRVLEDSRVLPTRSLVAALAEQAHPVPVFLQHCAIGYYGATLDEDVKLETSPAGSDFLAGLAEAWEAEATPVAALGTRLVVARTGVVLAADQGALPQMARPFRFFIGGPVASGRQYLSWIHLADWVRMIRWCLDETDVSGPYNVTAPNPVTNREFSQAIGRALRRPCWAPVPAPVLRLLFGEMADDVLVRGQRAVPDRALRHGFTFTHPTIQEALANLLRE